MFETYNLLYKVNFCIKFNISDISLSTTIFPSYVIININIIKFEFTGRSL